MPRREYQYDPLDLEPDIAIGVKLPFNSAISGRSNSQNQLSGSISGGGPFALSYTTEEQSLSNLKTFFLTRKGERLMHPTFGTTLYESIFEHTTDTLSETIHDQVKEDIKFWFPYIIIDTLDINMDADNQGGGYGSMMAVRLSYRVSTQGANQVLNIIVTQGGVGVVE
jgi:phage baseplate assembly protein W